MPQEENERKEEQQTVFDTLKEWASGMLFGSFVEIGTQAIRKEAFDVELMNRAGITRA